MKIGKKIKKIRVTERLSQSEFADLLGLSLNSLQSYELGRRLVRSDNLEKITNHPRFEKYTLWLMTGKEAPDIGQISPDTEKIRASYDQGGVQSGE